MDGLRSEEEPFQLEARSYWEALTPRSASDVSGEPESLIVTFPREGGVFPHR